MWHSIVAGIVARNLEERPYEEKRSAFSLLPAMLGGGPKERTGQIISSGWNGNSVANKRLLETTKNEAAAAAEGGTSKGVLSIPIPLPAPGIPFIGDTKKAAAVAHNDKAMAKLRQGLKKALSSE